MTASREMRAQPFAESWVSQEPDAFPHPLTSLVGRDHIAKEVTTLLRRDDVRLLTLTGVGGSGKTRLAIEVASQLRGTYQDGVIFVALAPIVDAALVLPTIAHAIGLTGSGGQSLYGRLALLLGNHHLLLLLDNFEQVVEAATSLTPLLDACPHLDLLVTSRGPLRLNGEREFAVPPLALGSSTATGSQEINPAVQLFVERAQAALPTFTLDASNRVVVSKICERLDGIPLAIELAATRVKVLTPNDILSRLAEGLDVLAGGPRDHPERHRSMRATIGWSYDLLSPAERRLLNTMVPFAAGCPIDIAEQLVGPLDEHNPGSSRSALDVIAALVDASLIQSEPGFDGRPRLTLLATIRQFVLERPDSLADRTRANDALVAWCLELAGRAAAAYNGEGPGDWNARLTQEHDNFRAGLTILHQRNDYATILRLATLLAPLWLALGHEREGDVVLTDALEHGRDSSPVTRLRALAVATRLASALGEFDRALALTSHAESLAAETGDLRGMADARCGFGNIARGQGNGAEASRQYDHALSLYRVVGAHYDIGYVLIQLGKLGDLGTVGRPGNARQLAQATAFCKEALEIYKSLGNAWGVARALHQLGYLAYKQRAYARAARLSVEALTMFCSHGNSTEAASPLEDLADVAGATDNADTAAQFYGLAEAMRERLGSPMWPSYQAEYEQEVMIARRALGDVRFREAYQVGRVMPLDMAVAKARALSVALASLKPTPAKDATAFAALARTHGLTTREVDVLRLLAAGDSNQAIASALFISVTTVKGHVRALMDKLGLRSRTSLATWAHTHHIAESQPPRT